MADRTSFRRIAPGPSSNRDDSASAGSSQQKEKTSTACFACRSRRTKCEGGEPCTSCVKHKTECVIDKDSDGRRKGVLKSKVDSLEKDRDLLIQLINTIRDCSNDRVIPLLNLIRSNASLEEIRLCIEGRLNDGENAPGLAEAHSQILRSQGKRVSHSILDVKRLSDIPLFKVPAKAWTNITDDDDFVSHLISLWFTWYHPYFNWIDRGAFIKDMQAGDLDCQFCSPFLVNIILADACAYSDYPETYAEPDDHSSKGMHFYAEARRLYEQEEGAIALSTIQGLGVMWVFAALTGKDRVRWMYQSQLVSAVEEFTRAHPPAAPGDGESERVMSQAVDNVIWGMYNITTASSISYHRLPLFKRPRRPQLPADHGGMNDKWIPYPSKTEELEAHTACMFKAHCSLNLIVEDVSRALFADERPLPLEAVEKAAIDLRARLQTWFAGLPECLTRDRARLPQVLHLHMFYHATLMTVFGLVKKQLGVDDGQLSIPDHEMHSIRLSSAREVARLVEIHRGEWGWKRAPAENIQWISVAQFSLLGSLDAAENRQAFVELCIAQRALSRRWTLGKAMLRSVQLTARQMAVTLPSETEALFAEFDGRAWGEKDRDRISGMYCVTVFPTLVASQKRQQVPDEGSSLTGFLQTWYAALRASQHEAKLPGEPECDKYTFLFPSLVCL